MTKGTVEELLARQAIRDTLYRYCRGMDRMDRTLADSVFHPAATANYHGIYEGSGQGFLDWVWQAHAKMERHSHQITNLLMELRGDTASSEAYVTVSLWTRPDECGEQQEIVGRGRYLDHWVMHAGHWVIRHREHVLDMQTIHRLVRGPVAEVSSRNSSDPSYTFLS
jgi:hypothetical protein